jgi:acyl-CoA synthetase (AMP-forming)/AMP-acid ligase II
MSKAVWPSYNFVELLTARAKQHPDRLALRFIHTSQGADITLSYAELHAQVLRLAGYLAQNAAPGDRALLLLPSGPAYVTALFACFYSGIIAVPAYPPQSVQPRHTARIASIARDATPALLLTETSLLERLKHTALPELNGVKLLAADAEETCIDSGFQPSIVHSKDLALLQYTSGSTSEPKGVMLSHGNLMANEAAIHHAFSIQPHDVIVSWLPLFHDMGMIGTLLQPLYAGVSAVLMATQRFMERPRRWLDAISQYGGTVSGAPDFAYRLCTERVDLTDNPVDLSRWRLAFCGAEPVRASTLRAFADKFRGQGFDARTLYPCYGLAESTLIVSGGERGGGMHSCVFSSAGLQQHRAEPRTTGDELVSCGRLRVGYELIVEDVETGQELPSERVGEILVSGPSVAAGYWGNKEATQRTFVERDGVTFLKTGDLGFVFREQLYVTGRAKDLIIVRGQNLYPQDIERSIEADNPVLRSGRVIAFELEHASAAGVAVLAEVNPRMKKLVEPAEVCREISEIVARTYGEAPNLVLLLEPGQVLLTSSGKLRRAATKQAWLDGTLQVLAAYGLAAAPQTTIES